MMKFSNHKKTMGRIRGFTLIEMLVAVFIFSIVMVISVGAIFSIVSANKTSQALKSVLDNLSSALDSMSREIRYGHGYSSDDPGSFSFTDRSGKAITYNFVPADSTDGGHIEKCINNVTPCVNLTAPEVHIDDLKFYVTGAGVTDLSQPEVMITIAGSAKAGRNSSPFNIETLVDQRNLK